MDFYFTLVLLIGVSPFGYGAPVKSLNGDPNLLKAFNMYKRLEPNLPQSDLKAITTVGILNGLVETEHKIEDHLVERLSNLLKDVQDTWSSEKMVPKIADIERQLLRDHNAFEILTKALDLATGKQSLKGFQKEMQKTLLKAKDQTANDRDNLIELNMEFSLSLDDDETNIDGLSRKLTSLRKNIKQQVNEMKNMMEEKVKITLGYLSEQAEENTLFADVSQKILNKRNVNETLPKPSPPSKASSKTMEYVNLEDMSKIISENITRNANQSVNSTMMSSDSTEFSAETAVEPMGGGGLVGLIASLSGGEGGSDIGALIGALTGVISTLFGPNGLDIEALISTATSLISGLLAGNKNFGTVLGIYVGTAVDGLSGGGGAINNGKFFGNLLGTVVASLSADPEEDDVPPRPLIFLQSLVHSFIEAKNRKLTDDEDDERRSDTNNNRDKEGTFDSAGFVKHILSSVTSGIVGILLNGSLGASGGAFQGSANAFSGNSHHNLQSHNKIW